MVSHVMSLDAVDSSEGFVAEIAVEVLQHRVDSHHVTIARRTLPEELATNRTAAASVRHQQVIVHRFE